MFTYRWGAFFSVNIPQKKKGESEMKTRRSPSQPHAITPGSLGENAALFRGITQIISCM